MQGLLSPSPAIDDLLNKIGVTPGGGPPGVASAQGMQPGPGPNMGPPPGLLGNMGPPQPHQSIGDRVHGILSDIIGVHKPAGSDSLVQGGLLSPEEMQAARPSLLGTIFGGGGDQKYKQNIADTLGAHATVLGVAQHHQTLKALNDIQSKYPSKPGETIDEMRTRYAGIYGDLLTAGTPEAFEMAKEVGTVMKGILAAPKTTLGHEAKESGIIKGAPDGKYPGQPVRALLNPDTGQQMRGPDGKPLEYLASAAPADPEVMALRTIAQANLEQQRQVTNAETFSKQDDRQAQMFQQQHSNMLLNAQKYDRFFSTLQEAKQGNPMAVAPLLYSMVSTTDLNAQMRQGILKLLETPAGALARGDLWFIQHVSGKMDSTMLSKIESLVRAGHTADKAVYSKDYNYATGKRPSLGEHPMMKDPESVFGPAGSTIKAGQNALTPYLPK